MTDLFRSSLVLYSKLISTPSTVYVVGLAKSFASYTLHVSALSAHTGELVTSFDIPSSITAGPGSLIALSHTSSLSPRVAWLEEGTVKSVALSPELRDKPAAVKGATHRQLIDVGLSRHGIFIAIKQDGAGRIVKLAEDGLKVVWDFADSVSGQQHRICVMKVG